MQTTEEEHIWFSKRLLFTLSVNFGVWVGCFNFLDFLAILRPEHQGFSFALQTIQFWPAETRTCWYSSRQWYFNFLTFQESRVWSSGWPPVAVFTKKVTGFTMCQHRPVQFCQKLDLNRLLPLIKAEILPYPWNRRQQKKTALVEASCPTQPHNFLNLQYSWKDLKFSTALFFHF